MSLSQSTGQAQAEREVGYLGPQACARHVLLVLPKWPPPGCPALAPVDGVSEPFPTPSGPGYHRANHSLYASERLGWSLPSAWVGMVPTQTPVTGLFARRWWGCASLHTNWRCSLVLSAFWWSGGEGLKLWWGYCLLGGRSLSGWH